MRRVLLALLALLVVGGALVGADRVGLLHVRLPVRLHLPRRPAAVPPPVSVAIPSITTNLADPGGSHYAQVTVIVAIRGQAQAKRALADMPAVENAVIADLRATSSSQLQGAGGMQRLGQALTASLDGLLGSPQAIQAVYFTQFMVQ